MTISNRLPMSASYDGAFLLYIRHDALLHVYSVISDFPVHILFQGRARTDQFKQQYKPYAQFEKSRRAQEEQKNAPKALERGGRFVYRSLS